MAPLRFSLFLSLVGCTCDYTSAYLMGRVARGRYLSATPRPLRPSAIPLLNREHLAIYSRCTVSRFPERLCVWQNGCHENRVPFFFVFFLPLTLSLSLSPSSAYHRVTFLIPIARIYSPRGSTEVLFFPLLLFFFLSFLFLLLREDKRGRFDESSVNVTNYNKYANYFSCYISSIFILLAK